MLGRYRLEARLASGGMGEVYLARMQGAAGFEKKVVIKRILPHLAESDEFVERFLDEGRIVEKLTHQNIVQVLDMGLADGQPYLAMEYVDGLDLRTLLQRVREAGADALPVPLVVHILSEVSRGLAYAHERRDDEGHALDIVHRDVSPSNVMVSRSGEVKLLDFGIAKAAGRMSQSISGSLHGKFLYMSPEQAAGQPLDPRSDLFSLGTCGYELLTGARPFQGRTELETLELIRKGEYVAVRDRRAEVPPEVAEIIAGCLRLKPEGRFGSAAELHRALLAWQMESRALVTTTDLALMVEPYLSAQKRTTPALDLDAALNQEIDALLGGGPGTPGTRVAAKGAETPGMRIAPRTPTPIAPVLGFETTGRAATPIAPTTDAVMVPESAPPPTSSRTRVLIAASVLLVLVLVALNLVTLAQLRDKEPGAPQDGPVLATAPTTPSPPATGHVVEAKVPTTAPTTTPDSGVAAAVPASMDTAGTASAALFVDASLATPDLGAPDPGTHSDADDAGSALTILVLVDLPDGAEVTLDGALVTPDASGRVQLSGAEGSVVVAVTAPQRQRFETTVQRAPGEQVTIAVKAAPIRRTVRVDTDPKSAELVVGGHVLGKGSARIPVGPDAPVKGLARLEGYHDADFTVKYQGPSTLSVVLKAKATARFEIRVFPATATVLLDGRPLAHSGNFISEKVAPGPHRVDVRTPDGKKSKAVDFQAVAGQTHRLGTVDMSDH